MPVPFKAGHNWIGHGDTYHTYSIDCPKTSVGRYAARTNPETYHNSMIHVFGGENLRDRIVRLLNADVQAKMNYQNPDSETQDNLAIEQSQPK